MAVKKSPGGWVRCLGWCNKKFYSRNRKKVRFCPKCAQQKDREQLKLPGITTIYDK